MLLSEITGHPRTPTADVLANAEQLGFDVSKLWYHGTRRRFDGFRLPKERGIDELGPGVYLTSKRWLANTWARKGGYVLTCVIRQGPLFDLAQLDRPDTMAVLAAGFRKAQEDRWGKAAEDDRDTYGDDGFADAWKYSRCPHALANTCLSAAGYVGGYKHASQIEGQVVVFRPEDVLIVARAGGRAYISPD
jgi:hypothetical protein